MNGRAKASVAFVAAGALLLGGVAIGEVAAPPRVVTKTVTKTAAPTEDAAYWKHCSAEWFRIGSAEGQIIQDYSQSISDALDSGDYSTGAAEINAITARIKVLTATIPTGCRQ